MAAAGTESRKFMWLSMQEMQVTQGDIAWRRGKGLKINDEKLLHETAICPDCLQFKSCRYTHSIDGDWSGYFVETFTFDEGRMKSIEKYSIRNV